MVEAEARSRKRWAWIAGGVLALVLILLFAALRPAAPREVRLLAGPEHSAYLRYAESLADVLRRHGITAEVVKTDGTIDNLERLAGADRRTIAFAQSGAEREVDPGVATGLVSLGSIAYEPLWLFAREDSGIDSVHDLVGHSVALGRKGSGSRAIAEVLLEANGIRDQVDVRGADELAGDQAADRLAAKELDAAFTVGPIEGALVRRMLTTEGVRAVPIRRARAYVMRSPHLARLDVPEGAVDLASNRPRQDLELVAATTNLVAREDVHDALVELVLDAAREINSKASVESPRGEFPSMKFISLPLSPRARHFFENGPSWSNRNLPYWLASIVDQLIFVIFPALAIVFTVLKVVPTFMNFRFGLQAMRYSNQMLKIERRLIAGEDTDVLMKDLARIMEATGKLHVPPTKADVYLELRQNIHDARERIEAHKEFG